METIRLLLSQLISHLVKLVEGIRAETKRIQIVIFQSRVSAMIKSIFEAFEAMLRAAIYLLILLMGLTIAGLGAYTILFLAIRIGQFLYTLILKDKWL